MPKHMPKHSELPKLIHKGIRGHSKGITGGRELWGMQENYFCEKCYKFKKYERWDVECCLEDEGMNENGMKNPNGFMLGMFIFQNK